LPQRPQSHVIGSRAAAAVAKVIADAGFAVETVVNDYGEDLLVQTAHAGQMDASRLWFQVKGTTNISRFRRKDGTLRYSFSFEQVGRWLRSADPVVVVLWDVAQSVGYRAMPMAQINAWERDVHNKRNAVLVFEPVPQFDTEEVRACAWVSRFYSCWRLLRMGDGLDQEIALAQEIEPESRPRLHRWTALTDFLALVGMIDKVYEPGGAGVKIRPESHRRVLELAELIGTRAQDSLSTEDKVGEAIFIAIAMTIEEMQEQLTGFRLEPPRHVIPNELHDAAAHAFRHLMFPQGWGQKPFELTYEQIVEIFRDHGVSGSIAIIADNSVPDVVFLLESGDVQALDRDDLQEILSGLFGTTIKFVTDPTPWDAPILPLTGSSGGGDL
jgi:hypothetical protein